MPPKGKKRFAGAFSASGIDAEVHAKMIGVDPEREPDVFEFLCKALEKPLPEPWAEHADKKGRIFYWNKASRHSSWQHPMAPTHKWLMAAYRRISQAADKAAVVEAELEAFRRQGEEELSHWRKSFAPDETPYYYKVGTQLTRWDDPRDELMGHMELRVEMLYSLLETEDRQPEITADGAEVMAFPDSSPAPQALTDGTVDRATAETPVMGKKGQASRPTSHASSRPSSSRSRASEMAINLGKHVRDTAVSIARNVFGHGSPSKPSSAGQVAITDGPTTAVPSIADQRSEAATTVDIGVSTSDEVFLAIASPEATTVEPSKLTQELTQLPGGFVDAAEPSAIDASLGPQQQHGGSTSSSAPRPSAREASSRSPNRSRRPIPKSPEEEQAELMMKAIIPDEIALFLGIDFNEAVDKMAFQILKTLIYWQPPLPWQVVQRPHGRFDFYNPGPKQIRHRHPLMGFFGEILRFLRDHAKTDLPITEALTAQVFREVSPQLLRERLGIWEGPMEDPNASGAICFRRCWKGDDEACCEVEQRQDDPRLEAAANTSFRLDAWLHLWRGFAQEEPFPLLEGRLHALSQQLAESVVTAPGKATEQMLVLMNHQVPELLIEKAETTSKAEPMLQEVQAEPLKEEPAPVAEKKPAEDAKEPAAVAEKKPAEDEKVVQSGVVQTAEMPEELELESAPAASVELISEAVQDEPQAVAVSDEVKAAASFLCCATYAVISSKATTTAVAASLEAEEAGEEEAFEEDEFDEEEASAYEEAPSSDEEAEEEETSEEEIEAQGERGIEPSPEAEEEQADAEEEEEEAEPEEQNRDPLENEEDEPQLEEEEEAPPLLGFLPTQETAAEWAERMLRPLTPQSGRQEPLLLRSPASPGKPTMGRTRRLGCSEDIWAPTEESSCGNPMVPPPPSFLAAASFEAPLEPSFEVEGEPDSVLAPDADVDAETPGGDEALYSEGRTMSHFYSEGHLTQREEDTQYEEPPLRPEREAQVDAFQRSLMEATSFFDMAIGEFEQDDEDLAAFSSAFWKRKAPEPEFPEAYSTGRSFLKKADMPTGRSFCVNKDDDYVHVLPGRAARPNSPLRGDPPPPSYLEFAREPPSDGTFPLVFGSSRRSRSSQGRLEPDAVLKRGQRPRPTKPQKPKPAVLSPRPHSASSKSRRRPFSIHPQKPTPLAEMAAQSTKRFLSRTCGTMQAALNTFDENGDGFFSRSEWQEGLAKLGFECQGDIQEIFSVLDRRQHHVLTLSDLFDYCNGMPVDTGIPAQGLRGVASILFQEVLDELMGPIVYEAIKDLLLEAFQEPSGPSSSLPDVNAWVQRYRENQQKQQSSNSPQKSNSSTPLGSPIRSASPEFRYRSESASSRLPRLEKQKSRLEDSEAPDDYEMPGSDEDSYYDEEEEEEEAESEDDDYINDQQDAVRPSRSNVSNVSKAAAKPKGHRAGFNAGLAVVRLQAGMKKSASAKQAKGSSQMMSETRTQSEPASQDGDAEQDALKEDSQTFSQTSSKKSASKEMGLSAVLAATKLKNLAKKSSAAKQVTKSQATSSQSTPSRGQSPNTTALEGNGRKLRETSRPGSSSSRPPREKSRPGSSSSRPLRESSRPTSSTSKPSSAQQANLLGKKKKRQTSSSKAGTKNKLKRAPETDGAVDDVSDVEEAGFENSVLGEPRMTSPQTDRKSKTRSRLDLHKAPGMLSRSTNITYDGVDQDLAPGPLPKWADKAQRPDEQLQEAVDVQGILKARSKSKTSSEVQKQQLGSSSRNKRHGQAHSHKVQKIPNAAYASRFSGFGFADSPTPEEEYPAKLLPWVPRPAEEICRTYSHIFRLLNDPRVKKLQAMQGQKRSLHVSVPKMPPLNHAAYGTFKSSEADHSPELEVRPQAGVKGLKSSKSSPALGGYPKVGRLSSRGSDGGTSSVARLPPLAPANVVRPLFDDVGSSAAIDAECR